MRSLSDANDPLHKSRDGSLSVVPPPIGSTVHSWLKSSPRNPSLASFACFSSLNDGSVIVGKRSISLKVPSFVVIDDKPIKTKFVPVIRTTFLVAPTSILAPIRSFATLLSATVAMVLFPRVSVAAPVPTKTLFLPATATDAVHLPTHFIAPAPYIAAAELHLPVLELLSALANVFPILISPVIPLPRQSKTWAVPATVVLVAILNSGAFFTLLDCKTQPSSSTILTWQIPLPGSVAPFHCRETSPPLNPVKTKSLVTTG